VQPSASFFLGREGCRRQQVPPERALESSPVGSHACLRSFITLGGHGAPLSLEVTLMSLALRGVGVFTFLSRTWWLDPAHYTGLGCWRFLGTRARGRRTSSGIKPGMQGHRSEPKPDFFDQLYPLFVLQCSERPNFAHSANGRFRQRCPGRPELVGPPNLVPRGDDSLRRRRCSAVSPSVFFRANGVSPAHVGVVALLPHRADPLDVFGVSEPVVSSASVG